MFRFGFDSTLCTACGICVDVCGPVALAQRHAPLIDAVGATRLIDQVEAQGTYPYLARPLACNGCGDCVRECPTGAAVIVPERSQTVASREDA